MALYYDVGTNRFGIHTNVYIYWYIYIYCIYFIYIYTHMFYSISWNIPFFHAKIMVSHCFMAMKIQKFHGFPHLSAMANLPGPQRSAEENQVRVLCRVEELQGTLPLLQRSTNPRYEGEPEWPSKWENIGSWMYITRYIYIILYTYGYPFIFQY